jgi:hypothetical protein
VNPQEPEITSWDIGENTWIGIGCSTFGNSINGLDNIILKNKYLIPKP